MFLKWSYGGGPGNCLTPLWLTSLYPRKSLMELSHWKQCWGKAKYLKPSLIIVQSRLPDFWFWRLDSASHWNRWCWRELTCNVGIGLKGIFFFKLFKFEDFANELLSKTKISKKVRNFRRERKKSSSSFPSRGWHVSQVSIAQTALSSFLSFLSLIPSSLPPFLPSFSLSLCFSFFFFGHISQYEEVLGPGIKLMPQQWLETTTMTMPDP